MFSAVKIRSSSLLYSPRMTKLITKGKRIFGLSLILLTVGILFLFFASGHRINFNDTAQAKMFAEMLIFCIAGIVLRSRRFSKIPLIILLLVQVGLIDMLAELLPGQAVSTPLVIFVGILFVFFIFNGYLIYLKARILLNWIMMRNKVRG